MSDKENPLPKPPKTPFGRRRAGEEEEPRQPLMADRMAMAMAEGKLDEFMKENLPDNEQARQLAMMMMSMTGMGSMTPPMGFPAPGQESAAEARADDQAEQMQKTGQEAQVPEDVMKAVQAGDMHQLMELLRREHQKRTGTEIASVPPPLSSPSGEAGFNTAPAGIEKEVLDQLIEIASANSVTLDWLILRAMKVYIEEYRQTGRL
ncbi:MAG: hypothetical protein FIA94_09510 [Nitrospirae bacterium]|nr:hypothetical protein [Nitrospirota bacterium]